MIIRFLLVCLMAFIVNVQAANVFPDLTNEEMFTKAQYFCKLTDYQSTRLFKLQYLFKILSNDLEARLNTAMSDQKKERRSIEKRVQLHHTIEEIRVEFAQLIQAYEHDVQSLLSKTQFNTLFNLHSRDIFVVSSQRRYEKIAFR